MQVPKPLQSMCHRWKAPEIAARPHQQLMTGNGTSQPQKGISSVLMKVARSDVIAVGGWEANANGKSSPLTILSSSF
jgi:hypothetical protein